MATFIGCSRNCPSRCAVQCRGLGSSHEKPPQRQRMRRSEAEGSPRPQAEPQSGRKRPRGGPRLKSFRTRAGASRRSPHFPFFSRRDGVIAPYPITLIACAP